MSTEATTKINYVGAPRIFALELACKQINEAFGGYGCYLVGSALTRADFRDIDIRFIMEDEAFSKLFPDTSIEPPLWEHDARWLLITCGISAWLSAVANGRPVDFQIQPQTHANKRHDKQRQPLGLRIGHLGKTSNEPRVQTYS